MKEYAILGLQPGEKQSDVMVARVRMFIGKKIVDEDFPLPTLPNGVPETEEVYAAFLDKDITDRIKTLGDSK